MKAVVAIAACLFVLAATPVSAQSGFYLPQSINTYGQDEFRASDGTTCHTTMDGTKRVEIGTFATGGNADTSASYGLPDYATKDRPARGNAGVYGRFSMSLDATPGRIDCNALFKLEMEKKRLEVELLKRSIISADARLDEQMRGDVPAAQPPAPKAAPAQPGRFSSGAVATKKASKGNARVAAKQGAGPPP